MHAFVFAVGHRLGDRTRDDLVAGFVARQIDKPRTGSRGFAICRMELSDESFGFLLRSYGFPHDVFQTAAGFVCLLDVCRKRFVVALHRLQQLLASCEDVLYNMDHVLYCRASR